MPSSTSINSSEVILSSPFRPSSTRWFLARARLLPDRIEFTGWTWKGRRKEVVPLDDVTGIRWRSSLHQTENFILERVGDTAIHAWMKGAGLWKYEIEALAPHLTPDKKRTKQPITHAA